MSNTDDDKFGEIKLTIKLPGGKEKLLGYVALQMPLSFEEATEVRPISILDALDSVVKKAEHTLRLYGAEGLTEALRAEDVEVVYESHA